MQSPKRRRWGRVADASHSPDEGCSRNGAAETCLSAIHPNRDIRRDGRLDADRPIEMPSEDRAAAEALT